MGQLYYIAVSEWNEFLRDSLTDWTVYSPVRNGKNLSFERITANNVNKIELNTYRATQPTKSFLFFFYEQITNIAKFPNVRGSVVLGLKGCDLNSLELYDKMFLEGEFAEPFYKRRRQDLLLIGCDCQEPVETCFCTELGKKPYPEDFFDINISAISNGFIVDVASERGEEFIKLKKEYFKKVVDRSILMKREAKRRATQELVENINKHFDIRAPFLDLLRKELKSGVWGEQAETCVTCGGCTQICPTCYCFLIEDLKNKKDNSVSKFRYWDGCQFTGFVRVAGGANARKKRFERLRHRYLHKFDHIHENFGFDGCTGCGRCIEVCPGKIDMRKVFSELKKAQSKNA